MTQPREHQDVIREAFTRQADSYADSARIADPEGRRAFVAFVDPAPEAEVLDVATGPGFVALAFAERVRSVTGVDITEAMLTRARSEQVTRGLANVRFQTGDATALPFPDGSFDVVTCGSAFHHFPEPRVVLGEMVRVLRPGGFVAISDLVSSEDAEQSARHNAIEQLRDPSHTRSLAVSELHALGAAAGLTVLRTETARRERGLMEWVAISRTPPEVVEEVRRMLIATIEGDVAGIGTWMVGDEPHFWHTQVWWVARKG